MSLSEQTIDELSERFEQCWSVDGAGEHGIKRFLTANGWHEPFDQRLLATLVIMDIERSWLGWHNFLKKEVAASRETVWSDRIEARFARLPTLGSYSELIPLASLAQELKIEIAEHEARARDRWGDAIGPEFFKAHYGVNVSPSADFSPRYVLIAESALVAEIDCARFQLRGLNRLGRQRSFDQRPLTCERLPEGNRVTISDSTNIHISRHQLTVQLLNPGYLLITNTGRNGSVLSTDTAELPANQAILCALPLDLTLARCHLRIR